MNRGMKQTLVGILIGAMGNVIGFLLYGLIITLNKGVTFRYFYENMFRDTDIFKSKIITGALLVNVILFYIFMRANKDELNRGILISILISVIAIVYFYA